VHDPERAQAQVAGIGDDDFAAREVDRGVARPQELTGAAAVHAGARDLDRLRRLEAVEHDRRGFGLEGGHQLPLAATPGPKCAVVTRSCGGG
jgi:hypothetical protein